MSMRKVILGITAAAALTYGKGAEDSGIGQFGIARAEAMAFRDARGNHRGRLDDDREPAGRGVPDAEGKRHTLKASHNEKAPGDAGALTSEVEFSLAQYLATTGPVQLKR
jgi:hypothetical protein